MKDSDDRNKRVTQRVVFHEHIAYSTPSVLVLSTTKQGLIKTIKNEGATSEYFLCCQIVELTIFCFEFIESVKWIFGGW